MENITKNYRTRLGCVPSATVAVCWGVPAPGGCLLQVSAFSGGVPALGSAWSRGCLVGGVCSRGCLLPGVSALVGACSQGGVPAPRGGACSQGAPALGGVPGGCLLLGGAYSRGCLCKPQEQTNSSPPSL